jgi:peptidoglycan/LPS O-acetylase OafA/YrhL
MRNAVEVSHPRFRVEPLDGLRTVAIAFVVLYHLHVPFFDGGFLGVNIFFALSGYLITSILIRERNSTGRIHLGKFWMRRLVRLYPTMLAVVVAVVCLWAVISVYSKSNVGSWMDAALALTYTGNIARWIWHRSMGPLAQTWSLGMEEQFYLVWPPVLALLLARGGRRVLLLSVLALLVVASSVGSWLLYVTPGAGATPDVYFSPILNVGPLLSGAILALAVQSAPVRERLAGRLGLWFTWIGGLAIVGINLGLTSHWTRDPAVIGVVLPLVGIASTVLIAGLISRKSSISRALSVRPIAWFGRSGSYALYLWHVMIIALILPLVPGPMGIVAAIAASVAVAIGSHYAIERPILAARKRWELRRAPARTPSDSDQVSIGPSASDRVSVGADSDRELTPVLARH